MDSKQSYVLILGASYFGSFASEEEAIRTATEKCRNDIKLRCTIAKITAVVANVQKVTRD